MEHVMTVSVAPEKSPGLKPGDEAADLAQIKAILTYALQGKSCAVYLFGSRATGAARPASDFDIAVLADEDISRELSTARDMLEESNIPCKVDVVDLRLAAPAFRHAAQTGGVLLWKN
jgi:predicted nucleotidyltransferase